MFVTIYLVLELFQTQISDQKDSFVHDVPIRLCLMENLRAFLPCTLLLLKQDSRKQTSVTFNDKRL